MDGRKAKGKNAGTWLGTLKNVGFGLGAVAFTVIVWTIAHFAVGNDYMFPSPIESLKSAWGLLKERFFWTAFWNTVWRAVSAFFISFVLGVIFAVLAYLHKWFRAFFAPIAAFLRALPTLSVALILLVRLTPAEAPVIVACLALFPMLYSSTLSALLGVDKKLIEACKAYRVPLKKRIVGLYLPTALPHLLREGAAASSFALKLTVSAEILAFTYESIGGMMQDAKLFLETSRLFALTVCIVLFACLLEWLLTAVAARVERSLK